MIIESPIGNLKITDNGRAIVGITVTDEQRSCINPSKLQSECALQLKEYFSGKRRTFDLPIELEGSEFQKSVWNALLMIPFGDTMTYGEIAGRIGKRGAARAVGGACNKNPILIVVPCHRAIGSKGKLIGFACGIDVKSYLLDHEKIEVPNV